MAACGTGTSTGDDAATRTGREPTTAAAVLDRPVVEVPAAVENSGGTAFLDAGADPRTELGRLRARYLPVWTSEFDSAFPPEVCDSAWELDSIAEPDGRADVAVLGDFVTAAALTVMRYEYQLSRALADPSALAQLCVGVAAVDPRRGDDLSIVASYLTSGARRAEPAVYPDEVVIVAASETSVVAVACVAAGYSDVLDAGGAVIEPARAPARLQAYLLSLSRGLEDRVTDISYRVSTALAEPAADCGGLAEWAARWDAHVQAWIDEGQIWEPVGLVLEATAICDSPPADGPEECPLRWPT